MAEAIALTLVVAVFNCDLVYRVWAYFRHPLKVNEDLTALAGKYRGWKLEHVTGRLLAAGGYTNTTTTYSEDTYTGERRRSTITNLHETFRLQRPDGTQTNAEVVNYSVNAAPGDVISIWSVKKGRKRFTLAVLNHTVSPATQSINRQDLFSIIQPHQIFFVVWLIMAIVPVVVLSVFGGAGLPALFFFAFVGLWAYGQKHVRDKFAKSGIAPIWRQSKLEANELLIGRQTSF